MNSVTVGQDITQYVLQFAGVIITTAIGWVSWKLSTWLEQKKVLSHAQANELIGHNLDLAARKAIEFAKSKIETPMGAAVDVIVNQNMIVRTAATYILPKFKETLDRLGYSPQDLEDFIRARLHLPVEPVTPVSTAKTTVVVTPAPSGGIIGTNLHAGNPISRS